MEGYTVKVEEARPAANGKPSAGPVYRCIYAKDGLFDVPQGFESPWDFFRFTFLCICRQFDYESRPAKTPMDSTIKLSSEDGDRLSDPSSYRRLIGRLLYLTITRPDLSYSIQNLSQFMSNPSNQHLAAANRVLRYIKATPGKGVFLSASSNIQINAYSDADWATCKDTRKSIIGNSLVSWRSKKQVTVSRSSAEAEYRALASTSCEIQWIIYLLQDMKIPYHGPAKLFTDSKSAFLIAHNPVLHERSKHIEIDCHFVREKVLDGTIKLFHVPAAHQIADILTKPLSPLLFNQFIIKMNMNNIHAPLEGC